MPAQDDKPDTSRVSIPFGKGMDKSVDEWLLRPPFATDVINMSPRGAAGSLRKNSGFTNIATLASDKEYLVSGEDSVLALGAGAPVQVGSDGVARSTGNASPQAMHAILERVRSGRGFIRDVQLAHFGGYTCVAYSVLRRPDVAFGGGLEAQLMSDFEVEVALLGPDWSLLAEPRAVGLMKWLPRVELVHEGGSGVLPTFAVFALGQSGSPISSAPSVFNNSFQLLHVNVECDLPEATLTGTVLASNCWPTSSFASPAAHKVVKYYDTASDITNTSAWYCVPVNVGAVKTLQVGRVTSGGAHTSTQQTLVATTLDHMAIYVRPTVNNTVLVYDRADAKVWYSDTPNMAAGWASVAAPALEGIDSAPPELLGLLMDDRGHVPDFWQDPSGATYLNERLLFLTGAGPGFPSFGASGQAWLSNVMTPISLNGETYGMYSYPGQKVTSLADARVWRGGKTLEMYRRVNGVYAFDAAIAETRLGSHNHKLYLYVDYDSGIEFPYSELVCVSGQMAVTADGEVLVPLAFLQNAQKPRNALELSSSSDNVVTNPLANSNHVCAITDGAGYLNDEQVIAVARVKPSAPEVSDIQLEGSTIVAAGNVCAWGNNELIPTAIRPPRILEYETEETVVIPSQRRVTTESVGLVDASVANPTNRLYYDTPFRLQVVLVYTDANGVEYRSKPSLPSDTRRVSNTGTAFPTLCPIVTLEIHPATLAFAGSSRALDVELYATRRRDDDPATAADVDLTTMSMVCRMPLQVDTAGYYVVDTMQDFAYSSASDKELWASPPSLTIPLYTVSGELEPDYPPSMSIAAQAGNYIFGVAKEAPYELWCTKPLVRGRGPEFSTALIITVPPQSGGVVSLGAFYDRLVVICKYGVWELPTLGGPDAFGAGEFPPMRLVYLGERCIGHNGTVSTPSGVFYVTESGPRLYDGSQDIDIGKQADGIKASLIGTTFDWTAVKRAIYMPDEQMVLWQEVRGIVGYDIDDGIWSRYVMLQQSMATLGGELVRLWADKNSVLLRDSAVVAQDDTRDHAALYQSAWVDLGDLIGQKKLHRIGLLVRINDAGSTGILKVSLEYDYTDGAIDTYQWTSAELAALSTKVLYVRPKTKSRIMSFRITVNDEDDLSGGAVPDIDWTLVGIEVQAVHQDTHLKNEAGARK